jgi:hypothetical protein
MNRCVLQMNVRTRWSVCSGFDLNVDLIQSTWSGEQPHLFQKRRGCNDSLSVGGVQLVDIDAVEVAECAMQSVSWCVSWVHDVRFRRLLAQKNEAGTLMSPAEALHQP